MNELTIIKRGEAAYIDSREVAEIIGKSHKNLIRDIRGYIQTMEKIGKLEIEPTDFFVASTYKTAQNIVQPCYLISKLGAEVVSNKLTGEKGVLFTVLFVKKFNEMEQRQKEERKTQTPTPRLCEFNSAVKNVLNGMSQCYTAPDNVMKFLRGVYAPLGIKVANNGDTPCFYTVTDIAKASGIYSASGKPHGHAVAAIISKLNIHNRHVIAVPYGLVGITYRYDSDVLFGVWTWITNNDYPGEVPYMDFDYHLYYKRGIIPDFYEELDDELDGYTSDELDAMCGKHGECDDCPGFSYCCEMD